MRNLQPVIWMKGTFLSPQHLQTQDRFLEGSMRFQLDQLNYRAWGFSQFSFDPEQLSQGNFVLTTGRGLFPDGLPFDIPTPDGPPPAKPLKEAFDDDQTELDIYLCIPEQRHQGLNVTVGLRDVGTRYYAENAPQRDLNSGLNEKPVTVARKNFRLLTGNESLDGYTKLRAARIKKVPPSDFVFDETFIPPILNIEAVQPLMEMTKNISELLWAKSTLLSNQRRMKNMSLADFGVSDVAKFWLLYAINSHYPLFQHIFEVRKGHPEYLYTTMLSLAGALTTFYHIHPRELPKYDHDNLSRCFTQLYEQIRSLIEAAIPASYITLPLKLVKNTIYATPLTEEKYLRNTRWFLAISSNINEGDLIAHTKHLVKVCSSNHIEHLVRHALPGVTLTHQEPRPPDAIPAKLNYQYFELKKEGAFWEAIERAKNFAAYVPAEVPNPSLELVILLPEAIINPGL
jgi:type VI secretion system protein ImpJ